MLPEIRWIISVVHLALVHKCMWAQILNSWWRWSQVRKWQAVSGEPSAWYSDHFPFFWGNSSPDQLRDERSSNLDKIKVLPPHFTQLTTMLWLWWRKLKLSSNILTLLSPTPKRASLKSLLRWENQSRKKKTRGKCGRWKDGFFGCLDLDKLSCLWTNKLTALQADTTLNWVPKGQLINNQKYTISTWE